MSHTMSCASAIKQAAPGLSDDDVEELLSAMIRRERNKPNRPGDRLRWAETAKDLAAEELLALKVERHARQQALLARTVRETRYAANLDVVQAMSDLLTTSERAGVNRAVSAESAQKAARTDYLRTIITGWDEAGVTPWLRSITPEMEADLARELARLNGAKVAASSDPSIHSAAEAVAAMQALIRRDMNDAGAWVGALEGRVTRTTHDANRMRAAGFDAWRDAILPRLDARTWDAAEIDPSDAGAVQRFLQNVYNNLVSGNHHVTGRDADPLGSAAGPGSLARKLSEDRVLHFRGPDEWLAYNREFGAQGLVAAIVAEAETGARAVGLMRVWGPNPETAFRQDAQRLADQLRDAGKLDESRRINEAASRGFLSRQWATVTGAADIPGSTTAARTAAAWRALETITSLGGVTLSSIPDLATAASTLRHEGIPYFKALANQVAALLPGYSTPVRAEVARRVGAGMNGLLGGLHHRFGYDTGVPGSVARATDIFFKLNLQSWWTDAQERGVAAILSSHVGESLAREWGDMDAGLRTSLQRYGVTEADWQAMRGSDLLRGPDGEAHFTPDMVDGVARQRIGAWFTSTLDGALTKPGLYERSILLQGQAPGTAAGEALRFISQFKSYPLSFVTRHLTREMYRQGQADFGGLAGLIAGTTILGYVSMTLKDYAAGRNPREPKDAEGYAKLFMRAMQQGGGLGIYGDFLFGDYNRFGGGLTSSLLGPAAGTVDQVARLFGTIRDQATGSDRGNLPAQLIGLSREVLPTNLFYSKLALDHLIIYQLQEAVDPGYTRRLRRRLERENSQTFWLEPAR